MPAWPLVASYTTGWLGYSSRERVAEQLEAANAAKAEYRQKIAASNLAAINGDPELLQFALAGGEAAFGDNCAPCHGRGAQGAFGFPNLRDDSWLWGGTLDAIQQTVQHGVRADDPQTRSAGAQMPAFGKSGVLTEVQIGDVTDELWLYGGDKATIAATLRGGRGGVMPAWAARLDPETIKELAIYVHSLGGGQ
jgi:cytochrome c oxidase cbb3-type subunit 3